MVIRLELPAETEARLVAQATARGISVEELLRVAIDIWLQSGLVSETAQPFYQTAISP